MIDNILDTPKTILSSHLQRARNELSDNLVGVEQHKTQIFEYELRNKELQNTIDELETAILKL